ncbi:bifunctional hydroxymethylpyrimidine kinase/phosphomethylpyrimidine kinase [Companilactobacillus mishanensis]|uniref:Hydroxymethylpyrimidine/phosphomethylpyrimidine kinase n=1 Tax=Companilactobacillus mishanensis TaxID=2486008 RepID=A0A5P0ZJ23_9LACO|nr:bifunctional hydroxymethylpyrimidine kinase/phosphomethylpyrimidine kinase [Companilactobacillus mishanensis]MQS45095.1 bifunctional hydroxymethylpyrimidine kinase/phosphomethylpyrimidine kinase [Companilactobacillus mishanensis]MQS52657.1 bifunctional hydroxymethylpyrimidine kinase/phosphomethylpyrimidine kinase [Companilactobacillus mishanensis]
MNDFTQVLTIAGSDSDGSAGAQADLKTFMARGVYGMSVLTAAVAGNSYGIHDSTVMAPSFIISQINDIKDDFKVSAFKTGMLADSETIHTVADAIKDKPFGTFVLDPVIITKHGAMLLEEDAYQTLIDELFPLADVITPNFYEAKKLADSELNSREEIIEAAHKLQKMGPKNIMIKGEHSDDTIDEVEDFVLLEDGQSFWISEPYVKTTHINGTGDTLSSAIVAEIAKGDSLEDAIRTAKTFTYNAIKNEIDVGHKFGPINHFVKDDIQ